MIVFNIITNNHELIEPLMNFLLHKHYAQSVQLDHEVKHILDENKKLKEVKTPKVSFITRAILYNTIEKDLFETFKGTEFIIYSIPISQMNQKHGNFLRNYLKKPDENTPVSEI